MTGYVVDIERATEENDFFRKVVFTAPHSQLVVMTLKPGEDIGLETHHDVDQFIRIEEGEGESVLDGARAPLSSDDAVVVPAGVRHNIVNTSATMPLRLYTVYSPANHPEGTVHRTKADAEAAELAHHATR
jgi:mannose-6-phosphate isomerase-like protein (cupin superfamily)